jgi:hypothetical protein
VQYASRSEWKTCQRGPHVNERTSKTQDYSKYIRPNGIPTEQANDGPNETHKNHVMEGSSNALSPKSEPVFTQRDSPAQSVGHDVVKRMPQAAFKETWCSLRQGDYGNEKERTSRHKKEWQAADQLPPSKRSEKKVGNNCSESGCPQAD